MGLGARYYVFLKNAFKGKLHCIHGKMLFNVNKKISIELTTISNSLNGPEKVCLFYQTKVNLYISLLSMFVQ